MQETEKAWCRNTYREQSFEKFYQENKNRFIDKDKAEVHTQKQSQNQSPMFKSYTHAMQH